MTEIDDEEYINKSLTQFRFTLNGLLKPLQFHGQKDYVDCVSEEIFKLAWQLHWRLCGVEIPYEIEDIHW